MDTSKIVGEKIKSLRESQSISMEELAQRSGLAIEHPTNLIPQTNRYVIYKHKIYLFQTYYLQRINRISY